jgi:23S rRNA (guanosine2251-2'-O)-methyltransferase
LIRTAAAVGVSAIFVPENNQAPVNGTVFKTSAGNAMKVSIVNNLNINRVIEDLQKNDF